MKTETMKIQWIVLLIVHSVNSNLNLFLSTREMKRLLGLEKELYYVRDGTINKYAMGFVIPVPSFVNNLHFTWYSYSPIGSSLQYSLATSSSHPTALPSPLVNISRTGNVPDKPQIWKVDLQCTGTSAAEVVITVDISITGLDQSNPLNVTKLKFKRKKACIITANHVDDVESENVPAYVIFFAGVGSCLVILVIIVSLVIATWMKSTKSIKTPTEQANSTQYTPIPTDNTQNNSAMHNQTMGSLSHLSKVSNSRLSQYPDQQSGGPGFTSTLLPTSYRSNGDGMTSDPDWGKEDNPTKIPLDKLVVNRLDLVLGDLLLEGTFSRVYQGRLSTLGDTQDVMVKTIVMGSSEAQAVKLVTEGSLLYPISHKHVVPLLATTSDGSSPMMIYQYLNPGNLKRWLSGCHQPVSTHQCVNMGLQLLTALKHIHKKQIVHKDVAARNCFLTSNLSIKLCDPALSKDLFPNDYHCLGDNENRPVKWMAIETLSSGSFTTASDVWSWAVTMWEVLTRAQQPFPDVDPFEMETYLMEGFRLHQPLNCPDQLYTVMVSCWAHSAHHRASVQTLYNHLVEFNTQLQQFV